VLTRYHGIEGHPGQGAVEKQQWERAQAHTPHERVADYTQAIMDLGATVCVRSRPLCLACPLTETCVARREGRTAQLPTPKPGKTLPTRETTMLVLRDAQGRVLLERRGPTGVWSGLWSLPEAVDHDAAWRLAQAHAQLDDAQPLSPFVHVFSHYRLNIEPLLFDGATARTAIADNAALRWYARDAWPNLGLPAPVRTLLESLAHEPQCLS
jgi:A/G-specific adenine glycosylase